MASENNRSEVTFGPPSAAIFTVILRIHRLKRAVERNHNCAATHAGSRLIVEPLPNGGIWRGLVEVFDLAGHPRADRCYAWMEPRGRRSVSITRLRTSFAKSAQTAVRAALAGRLLTRLPKR